MQQNRRIFEASWKHCGIPADTRKLLERVSHPTPHTICQCPAAIVLVTPRGDSVSGILTFPSLSPIAQPEQPGKTVVFRFWQTAAAASGFCSKQAPSLYPPWRHMLCKMSAQGMKTPVLQRKSPEYFIEWPAIFGLPLMRIPFLPPLAHMLSQCHLDTSQKV